MAKKSTNTNSKSNGKAQSSKTAATQAKKAAKKAYKANPKAFIISVVAIILVAAIATAVVYFAFPDTWDSIISSIKGNKPGGDTPGGDTPGGDTPPLAQGEGDLFVHMIDVGQGDCIYIKFPDGKDMVIDCGNFNDNRTYQTQAFDYLDKYISDNTIEYLMLTHCDSDHVYYMDNLLDRYQVNKIFMPNVLAAPGTDSTIKAQLQEQIDNLNTDMFTDKDTVDSRTYAEFFIAALTEPNCEIVLNVDPDESTNAIVIEETTYKLTFYCPTQQYYDDTNLSTAERKNAISPIGILEYNSRRIVLTGDSNEINEPLVAQRTGKIDCDVLKVGHHGSETSSIPKFLDAYTFEYAIISCNAVGNKFNHPRQNTLDRFKERNIFVYRTDNNGHVVVSVDKDGKLAINSQKEWSQEKNLIGLTGSSKT